VTLSDINMPGMDGLELLGKVKQLFRDIPVMMVTAYGGDERPRRASDIGPRKARRFRHTQSAAATTPHSLD